MIAKSVLKYIIGCRIYMPGPMAADVATEVLRLREFATLVDEQLWNTYQEQSDAVEDLTVFAKKLIDSGHEDQVPKYWGDWIDKHGVGKGCK